MNKMMQQEHKENRPIGIFDSGVGGLTVFKEIRRVFPNEDILYFGDTARVPYGTKSKQTVINYSKQNTRFLLNYNVKVIVVACNTSSALALKELQKMANIPILGVINAGAETAVKKTKNGNIGVIGTVGTINSKAYLKAIKKIDKYINVIEKSCPLFVPLAEEGWHNSYITKQVAEIYLRDMLIQGIDTLVLGCTHYPILKKSIQEVCGDQIQLIDSAEAVAQDLKKIIKIDEAHSNPLSQKNTNKTKTNEITSPKTTNDKTVMNALFVSDYEDKFVYITRNVLDIQHFSLSKVQLVDDELVHVDMRK